MRVAAQSVGCGVRQVPAAVQSAGGNQTYDGRHRYTFDAWNRLAKVYRA